MLWAVGCSNKQPATQPANASQTGTQNPNYFESTAQPGATTPAPAGNQVNMGKQLYAQSCASCHGAQGQGTAKAPAVVGASALPLNPPAAARTRKQKFHTAADVLDFIKKNMPLNAPGSLTDEQYAAILAFDLTRTAST